MPLTPLKELSPEDRATYRRWVGGLFATYGTIALLLFSIVTYHAKVAPAQTQSAGAEPTEPVRPAPVRQAVKYD